MPKWTEAQQDAIAHRGSTLLVSAAAGSGKTAVLTARILALVQEGARIDDMLVVTFTNAAAAEMRARILQELHRVADTGDAHLARQAMHVERADIQTLHRFCGKVCRDHFQAAGVDPTFRVVDTAEAAVLRDQAMLEALTECFAQNSLAFSTVALWYTQDALIEAVTALYRFLMARPDPWVWLDDAISAHDATLDGIIHSLWMETMLQKLVLQAETAVGLYDALEAHAQQTGLFVDFAAAEAGYARTYLHHARQGYAAVLAIGAPVFERRPSKKKDMDAAAVERFVALRDAAKDALSKAGEVIGQIEDAERLAEDELDIGLALAGLGEAVRAFHARYAALKTERNLLDFYDLEHCALRALETPSVSEAMRRRYAYVFVDEYQDSSLLQEAILQRVSRPDNLFMVGDVKQSIYRFRLAEPGLFLHKLRTFSLEKEALHRRIALSANFRSTPAILRAVNAVFEQVFSGGAMELAYEPEVRLVPGREAEAAEYPVEVHLLGDTRDDEDVDDEAATAAELSPAAREGIRQEAEIIAGRIQALQTEAEGGYALREMAILMRVATGKAAQVVEVLRARGIAAWSDLGEDALARPEIQAIVSILQVIDNLRQDIPLMAALRGPAMGLEDEALSQIRVATPQGAFAGAMLAYAEGVDELAAALRGFIERVRGWALDAQVLPLDCLLRQLYNETGHYAQSGARPDGEIRQANLRMLAEHAGAYQRAQGGGLGGFLRYLERVRAQEGLAAQELGEQDNVVRVMTIHKSKGLQYPVVFVAGMGRRFRQMDAKNVLQAHTELGLGLMHIDPELRTKHPSLSQQAILERKRREDIAEEARVLYVAMTRVEERLILTGVTRPGDMEKWSLRMVPSASAAASMLDWIVPAAQGKDWQIAQHQPREVTGAAAHTDRATAMADKIRTLPPPRVSTGVAEALAWRGEHLRQEPIKRSVSSIVRAQAKRGEEEDTPTLLEAMPKRPLFMEARGLTAAERGDAVHAFLGTVPLDTQDLDAACRSMVESGILSAEQARSLPMAKLARCLQSDVWQRMRAATVVHREWPFNLREEDTQGLTLVQGVIDCCFLEDGQWTLVDYKSDRADDVSALLERYQPQLALYARALEQITRTPIREQLLFLIEQGKGYEVYGSV